MPPIPTLVVVPMKDPAASKTRLSGALDAHKRAALASALLRRTLRLLNGINTDGLFDIAVVTPSSDVARIASESDVRVIREDHEEGLNQALNLAARFAIENGYRRLCAIPADLAAPDPEEILKVVEAPLSEPGVVICPSWDLGTNALALTPPDAIDFCFGPQSARCHVEAAEARGITPILLPLESIKYDIDTTECLARALSIAPDINRS